MPPAVKRRMVWRRAPYPQTSFKPGLFEGVRRALIRTVSRTAAKFGFRPSLAAFGLAAAAAAAISTLAVFGSVLSSGYTLANLEGEADPLLLRDMRLFVGVPGAESLPAEGDLPPLDLSETFRYDKYMVRRGDSVSSIAAKHSLSVSSIIASNSISNAKRLMAGTVLKIPNMDGLPHKVRRGDTLSGVASSYGIPVEAILDANDLDSETIHPGMTLFLPGARMRGEELRRVLGDLFVYPVRGRLTSGYGWRNDPFTGVRRFHAAIDLAAPLGTPLTAAMDGRVSTLGFNSVYGKYIILSHSGGYQTLYAHLNEFRVQSGSSVRQGARIGDVGNTGYSTGSHLHFAVFKNGRALNPLTLLASR
jgi:LysM repeat protein